MPIYEFLCEACGPFEQRRSMEESNLPMACPACQAIAKRVYSAPGFILTSSALRRRIENSAEPKVVTRPRSEEPAPPAKPQIVHTNRPWQIGHGGKAVPVNPKLERI